MPALEIETPSERRGTRLFISSSDLMRHESGSSLFLLRYNIRSSKKLTKIINAKNATEYPIISRFQTIGCGSNKLLSLLVKHFSMDSFETGNAIIEFC